MSRNRGGNRGGGGGHTSPPPASGTTPTPGPATAPAGGLAPAVTPAPVAPTPPAPPAEEAPEELRSFEEGGGELVPRKYLGWGALVFVIGIALYALPWGKWWDGVVNGVGDMKVSWLVAGAAVWLGAFGYFLYKKDSRAWLLLAIAAFLWWADQPYKGGAPTAKPAVERKVERKCFEVRLPEYGETDWIKTVPICAPAVHFDGTKPFEVLFLGGKGGWKEIGPETDLGRNSNTFKLRRAKGIVGEVIVRIAYDD